MQVSTDSLESPIAPRLGRNGFGRRCYGRVNLAGDALAEMALAATAWQKWLLPERLGRNGLGRRCFGRHGFFRVDNGWAALAFTFRPQMIGIIIADPSGKSPFVFNNIDVLSRN